MSERLTITDLNEQLARLESAGHSFDLPRAWLPEDVRAAETLLCERDLSGVIVRFERLDGNATD